jgi:5-methylcytosine-specific restriction enzyme subunit McrC
LREELSLTESAFPDGRRCPRIHLDAGCKIALEPDLSWWDGPRCRFVGDVKYKAVTVAGVKHPDLYQLLAYTTATELSTGLLVYAKGEREATEHDITLAGKRLCVESLELAGSISDLHQQVRGLAAVIRAKSHQHAVAVA